ncbi:MAG: DUF4249 domain-containing protein [Bacteroidia bacterium]
MKNSINILFMLFISTCILTSCQKVIDVTLKNSSPQIVIEANIANDSTPCTVSITKTVNFSDENNYPGVDGASVILSDNMGHSEILQMESSGIYQSKDIFGVEGRTYTVNVIVEGKSYNATSTMPYHTNIDAITVDSISFAGTTSKQVTPYYTDSSGLKNYYHLRLFVNNKMDKTVTVENDDFTDGKTVAFPLSNDLDINEGDNVRVELECIDKSVYLYYFSLSQSQSGPNSSAAPANPVSNFSGGCLGYFSACARSSKSILIQ